MRKDFESKINASQKVKTSISNTIESQLLEENNDTYYEDGIKNWTLLRKHVHALQSYSKKNLNGKIPPKHQLLGPRFHVVGYDCNWWKMYPVRSLVPT